MGVRYLYQQTFFRVGDFWTSAILATLSFFTVYAPRGVSGRGVSYCFCDYTLLRTLVFSEGNFFMFYMQLGGLGVCRSWALERGCCGKSLATGGIDGLDCRRIWYKVR